MSHVRQLTREQVLPRPRHEVFAFFAQAENLERITPPSLRFEILTPLPISMGAGTRIEYRLKLFGFPFRWQTLIELYEPEYRFVDVQVQGPYSLWRHTHTFETVAGGTHMRDHIEYALPLGMLGNLAHALFVRRQLESIFDYRARVIESQLSAMSR